MTTHKMTHSPIYGVWDAMIQRCTNPKSKYYYRYGGRGIIVCDEWLLFEGFYEWVKTSNYDKGLQIDRINNDDGYYADNCEFVTPRENTAIGKRNIKPSNTGYVGVILIKATGRYTARININYKAICLGTFDNIEDALKARINAEIKYFGEQKTNLNT